MEPREGEATTVLFVDVEGEAPPSAGSLIFQHERIVNEALRRHGGGAAEVVAGGLAVALPSASRALACAVGIQSATERSGFRVGLAADVPIAADDRAHRRLIEFAARIAARAESGDILVSEVVRNLVKDGGFLYGDRGTAMLPGSSAPVRLFEVRWWEHD